MKTTPMHVSLPAPLQTLSRQVLLFATAASIAGAAASALAQTTVDKANSYTSLATPADWQGTVVPGANNIAVWNSGSGTPQPEPLGADLAWAGIQILNPGGPVVIAADGNTLTNGEVGVVGLNGLDMSSATVSLTLSNNLVINGVQNWKIASGQTLNIDGVLSRNEGGVVRMYFDPGTTTIYTTNGSVAVNNVDTAPNAMLGGTYGNNFFATINDTDFVAEVSGSSGFQLVPGSTVSGLYTPNSTSTTPSDGQNETVLELVNPVSVGDRLSNNRTYGALLFDTQQTNTINGPNGGVGLFQGIPAWNVFIPSGRTLTINAVLCTTGDANSPMLINNGGVSGGTVGNFRIGNGGQQDLLIYQNDPAASLIVQPNININQQGTGSLVKIGIGTMQVQGSASYTGGTKIYEGTLEIDGIGSVNTGPLNVYGGTFAQSSGTTNHAPTTFFGGTTNIVVAIAANSQSYDSSTVTFDAGATMQFFYSNNIAPSATAPALTLTNINGLTLNSPVNVQFLCGSCSVGTFPLISYAGTLRGAGSSALSSLTLPPHIFGYLSNDVTHSLIDVVVTNVDQPIAWNTGNGTWDVGQTANWLDPLGNTTTYQQLGSFGDNVIFDDGAPGPSPITVTLNEFITPSSVTVSNANNTYIISGAGDIGGAGAFIKTDSGTVTLETTNSFEGGIDINNGAVIFTALPNLGAGAINFGGGALEYNGNADDISTRTVNLNAGGGTINTAGSTVNFANPIGNNSVGGLAKTGAGTLTLNGTNTYAGNTVVNQGTLALGANTYLTNSAAIIVNSGAVLDSATSGVNLWLSSQVSQTLEGVGQVNGIVTVGASTTCMPAAGGLTGTLNINGGLAVDGGTLNMTLAATSNDVIAVTGDLTITGGAVNVNVIGALPIGAYNLITYSGTLTGSPGTLTLTGYDFAGADESGTLINSSGKIELLVGSLAQDNLAWSGSGSTWDFAGTLDWLNGATPWAYTNGDAVTFNDSASGNYTVNLEAALAPGVVTVSNTVVPTYTFADGTGNGGGNIAGQSASLVKDGTGTLIVETANTYQGPTTIKNGTLQVGNGAAGDIGNGNVTNNGALVFQQGDQASHIVAGSVSGTGSITENANATVVLTANNSYTGPTTISQGTLQVGNGHASGSLGATSAVTNNGALVLDESGSFSFPYDVSGSGTFAVAGPGTLSLAGSALSYLGQTYISNGVVKLEANNQLPNANNTPGAAGILNLDGGGAFAGVLDLSGFNLTLDGLSGLANNVNGIITNSSTATSTTNILTVDEAASSTYNGQIMDHGTTGAKTGLFVTGPGILTLNPTTNYLTGRQTSSTFSGGMVISNGSVVLGTPGSDAAININESQLAPGTGPITLLGTNAILTVAGASGSTVPTYTPLTNTLIVPAGQTATVYGTQRGTVNSSVIGSGMLNYITIYVRGGVDGDWSGFSGQLIMSATTAGNGNFGFGQTNGLPNATLVMTTNVDMYFGAINAGTPAGVFPIGALSGGDSSCQLEGAGTGGANAGAVNATFEIGGINSNCTYSGGIVDTNNLLKVGTGTFTLNCGGVLLTNSVLDTNSGFYITEIAYEPDIVTYSGSTTVSNGTLALDAPVNLTSSTNVIIAAPNAVLDASDMGYISNLSVTLDNGATQEVVVDSTFEVVTNRSLGGIGTLNGFLQADQGSTLAVGLPTGAFNVTSNATLAGAITMNLNSTDAVSSGFLSAPSFTISPTATLVVTNIGPGLTNGASFTLFSHPVSGFASVTLPPTDPTGTTNYIWQNYLAVNGSITLTNGGTTFPTIPPKISFTVSGTTLTLTWPSDYLGDILQVQTNSLQTGLGTNWVDMPGSGSATSINITINPGNPCVFYRLAP
ncbi:MAG: beta strand repeat-containing protein [Limisphaerales bacterium]